MISLITPTHNPKFLERLYNSLIRQHDKRFEWVIVPNNGVTVEQLNFLPKESWIRIVPYPYENKNIGAIKNFAFRQGTGDWLAEVDHDDELVPFCTEALYRHIGQDSTAHFFYSDSIDIKSKDRISVIYDTNSGWQHYGAYVGNEQFVINRAFKAIPQTISRIWYAPNHIRMWKKTFYYSVGGHDNTLKALDDLDLICRTYIHGKMSKIDYPLYIYHIHDENSFIKPELNDWIQNFTWTIYEKYISLLMEKWCSINGLTKLDLCGGINKNLIYTSIDIKNADITWDLNNIPWPIADNSVGVVRARDALEHMKDPIKTMTEIHRILAPGGMLLSDTPSTDGRGAFQDPTHVSFWNINSFWYYTRKETALYIGTPVRFQATRVKNYFPSNWHETNNIPYVKAHLTALKGGDEHQYAPGGIEI